MSAFVVSKAPVATQCWQCEAPASRSKTGIGACMAHLLPGRLERRAMAKASRAATRTPSPARTTPRAAHVAPTPIRAEIVGKPAIVQVTPPPSAIVDLPTKPAAVKPDVATGPVWTPEQSVAWLEGVVFGKPATYSGHKEITVRREIWDGNPLEVGHVLLTLVEHNSEWTIERQRTDAERKAARGYAQREALDYPGLPLKSAKAVAARELKGLPRPAKNVTRYSGGLPLKRELSTLPPSRNIMAEARARVRSGAALAALTAECELVVRP